MTAHRNNSLSAHRFSRKYSQQADCSIADYHNRRSRLYVCCVGRKPTGAQDIGRCQQTRYQFFIGTSFVATNVPSASGTRRYGACALVMNSRCTHDD